MVMKKNGTRKRSKIVLRLSLLRKKAHIFFVAYRRGRA